MPDPPEETSFKLLKLTRPSQGRLHLRPLKDFLLHDCITLRDRAWLADIDVRTLEARFGIVLVSTGTEKRGRHKGQYYEGKQLLDGFDTLTTCIIDMFTGRVANDNESGNEQLDWDDQWQLIFAGREGVSFKDGETHPTQGTVVHHLWRLPSGNSVLDMMEELRSNVPYSLLQRFIALEHQSLLTPSSPIVPTPSTTTGGTKNSFIHTRVRVKETAQIYGYLADLKDAYTNRGDKYALVAFAQRMSGDLNTFEHIWQLPKGENEPSDLTALCDELGYLGSELLTDERAVWLDPMSYNATWNNPPIR